SCCFGSYSFTLGISLIFILSTHSQTWPQQTTDKPIEYHYDTPGVDLSGVLLQRNVYGPPGYGETPLKDSRQKIYVLRLSKSISVEPAPNAEATGSASLDTAENVREIQLFVPQPQKSKIAGLVGRAIEVNGTLNESVTASQYSKVCFEVASLKAR
ncbi:MAG TPA: hypothetical protein VJV22_18765, partial [Acidobacteriaceae bacterium]|nr:hypothetical protein [Acidobacteriaceae bacterium]